MIGTFVSLNFELRNLKLSKLQVAKVQNQKISYIQAVGC